MNYKYIKILCEGQSEESFIKRVLALYLEQKGIYVQPIVLNGVSRYACIRRELRNLGKDSFVKLTTMLDYYKLPQDTPGVKWTKQNKMKPEEAAVHIENQIWNDLKDKLVCKEFFPYIQLHEYEALLLSDIDSFQSIGMNTAMIAALKKEISKFPTPEYVNNSEQTAPSKRILRVYKQYQKISDGTIIAETIGIEKMLEKCPHFAEWVKKLQQ